MIRKHLLRNRNLALWLGGATLLGGSCGGGTASGVLGGVSLILQIIASAL